MSFAPPAALEPSAPDSPTQTLRLQAHLRSRNGTLLRCAVKTRKGAPPNTQRPDSIKANIVAHCDDSNEGDYVNSLAFIKPISEWAENRAVWNKSANAVLVQLKELEKVAAPYTIRNFHTDNAGKLLN